jgi:CheY-like chemotaxis protein
MDLPILVVDDDADVRAALGDLLRRWGVRFDAAASGEAALRLVDEGTQYGLVLADYRLGPGLNGLDLIAGIIERHNCAPPSAALVTADFDPGLIGAAGAAGVPILHKPVRPLQLRALLGIGRE